MTQENQRSNSARRIVLKRRASNLERSGCGSRKGYSIGDSKGGSTVYRAVCCTGKSSVTRFEAPVLPPSFQAILDNRQP